jgi:4-amino-4-deoxy-L-arabinose transferase-like glycosyltransferase
MQSRSAVFSWHDNRASVIVPALAILIGIALRFVMLGLDIRFHPDEALFAAQARLISHQGDLLLRDTDLDKPPLTFYVTALSFRVLGPTEFAARLPNVLFSDLGLVLVYALAWSLYRDQITAALAVWLLALSPYDLAFAATAFTDIQATFWVLAAAWLAVHDRWTAAGIAAALIFAAKSNALIMLPLIAALGIAHNARPDWRSRDIYARLGRLMWPLALGAGLLILWDMGRTPRSFFDLGYTRNNPGRLIRADELWPRLERWTHWLGFITGSRLLNVFLLAVGPVQLAVGVLRARSREIVTGWVMAGFGLAFVAWHWLIAFNTYDRYLHLLAPFLVLLAARLLTGTWRALGSHPGVLIALVILVVTMIPAVTNTLRGDAAIGGDQGHHTGIDRLADYLNTRLSGEIVYDHWLGWELAYYLGESPQVITLYAPLPEALAEDMAQQSYPRYFAAPSPQLAALWLDALRRSGVETSIIYHDTANHFVIYRLAAQNR